MRLRIFRGYNENLGRDGVSVVVRDVTAHDGNPADLNSTLGKLSHVLECCFSGGGVLCQPYTYIQGGLESYGVIIEAGAGGSINCDSLGGARVEHVLSQITGGTERIFDTSQAKSLGLMNPSIELNVHNAAVERLFSQYQAIDLVDREEPMQRRVLVRTEGQDRQRMLGDFSQHQRELFERSKARDREGFKGVESSTRQDLGDTEKRDRRALEGRLHAGRDQIMGANKQKAVEGITLREGEARTETTQDEKASRIQIEGGFRHTKASIEHRNFSAAESASRTRGERIESDYREQLARQLEETKPRSFRMRSGAAAASDAARAAKIKAAADAKANYERDAEEKARAASTRRADQLAQMEAGKRSGNAAEQFDYRSLLKKTSKPGPAPEKQ